MSSTVVTGGGGGGGGGGGANILDVLKKKMRQTREEMESYREECEDAGRRMQAEVHRREEVSYSRSRAWRFPAFLWRRKKKEDLFQS